MESFVLDDKSVQPTEKLIFSIIRNKEEIWKQTLSYLNDHHKDITEVWKYYNDGKSWLFRTMQKKKTIFWIKILEDTFRIAFYFAERLEPQIMESQLSERLKEQYRTGKSFNKSRAIYIDVADSKDLEDIKVLIDLKMKLK